MYVSDKLYDCTYIFKYILSNQLGLLSSNNPPVTYRLVAGSVLMQEGARDVLHRGSGVR